MEIIKIKEQSINAEESKLYKKMLDSTVVTDTGLFIMTETDYGVTCMNDLSRKNNLERLEKIRKGLSILDPKSKDEEIMQLYKLGLYEDPLMSL